MAEIKVKLIRDHYTKDATFGKLFIDGDFFGYTLEDTVRPTNIKVYGHTAIPASDYRLQLHNSPRFGEVVVVGNSIAYTDIVFPDINFKYVYFHGGNKHEDTLGCILVNKNRDVDANTAWGSLKNSFTERIKSELNSGNYVTLEVINNPQSK